MKLILQLRYATMLSALAFPSALFSAEPAQRVDLFDKLLACRNVMDPALRLACFDDKVAAMEMAVGKKEIVVVDCPQIRTARRSLFGLTLPNLDIFGGGDADRREGEGFSEIESTI